MKIKCLKPACVAIGLIASASVQAASISSISVDINFTLADILVNGTTASPFDYDPDVVDGGGYFSESYAFGGSGSTTGSSTVLLNGNPTAGTDLMQIGDTLSMSLYAETTSNAGFVNRDQVGEAGFSYLNYTDNGLGDTDILTFMFNYEVSYFTSLYNDVNGDQAIGELLTLISIYDYGTGESTVIDLFPQNMPGSIQEYHFGTGEVNASDFITGTFSIDLAGSEGYFIFQNTLSTPTMVQPVPVPAAVWLFGSGLMMLAGLGRKIKSA
ncbi:MAG: VPLPA-CTERM sorting domain-containing protein [Candidatus Thiodiazotropha sp.]